MVAFRQRYPNVAVRCEGFLTGEIYGRVVRHTDAGQPTADMVFSSATELQIELANDGYARHRICR